MEEFGFKIRVDFLAQPPDIHVHQVRAGVEIIVPDLLQNPHPPAEAARGTHQKFEQPVFARGQFDVGVAALRPAGQGVQRQVRHAQHRRFGPPAAPGQRPHPRHQLGQGERLRQVIVGSRIQPFDALVHLATGGKEQDRRGVAAFAPLPQDAQPVPSRQHDVQHDAVEGRAWSIRRLRVR